MFCSPTPRECLGLVGVFLTISMSAGAIPFPAWLRERLDPSQGSRDVYPKPPGCSGNENAELSAQPSKKPHSCFLGEGLLESAAPAFHQLPCSSFKPSNVWINPSFLPSMDPGEVSTSQREAGTSFPSFPSFPGSLGAAPWDAQCGNLGIWLLVKQGSVDSPSRVVSGGSVLVCVPSRGVWGCGGGAPSSFPPVLTPPQFN